MTIQRAFSVLVALCAALLVSGCFVVSKHLPAGTGVINDDRLVGNWRGFDTGSGKEEDAYLHFQKPDPDKPLRLVWVEDSKYLVYEVVTTHIGSKDVFAAKLIAPQQAKKERTPHGYFVGFYEVTGNEVVFHLLDAEKISALITQGKLKGTPGKKKYDFATLSGSPVELARFLSSPEAWTARAEPARLRRLPQANK